MYRDGLVAWDNLGPLGLSFVVVGMALSVLAPVAGGGGGGGDRGELNAAGAAAGSAAHPRMGAPGAAGAGCAAGAGGQPMGGRRARRGLVLAPLGIVAGHIARSEIRRIGQRGGGMALAGAILGYLWVALIAATAIVVAVTLSSTH